MTDVDRQLWEAFVRGVTPLGQPVPSQHRPVAIRQSAPINHTLDLHGLTVSDAHRRLLAFLEEARGLYRRVTVITGLSGAIRREFLFWLEDNRSISHISPLNGGGAFLIRFRKSGNGNRP